MPILKNKEIALSDEAFELFKSLDGDTLLEFRHHDESDRKYDLVMELYAQRLVSVIDMAWHESYELSSHGLDIKILNNL